MEMSLVRDPIKTRQKSASQERRNSVSDIKEYFLAKNKDSDSPMPPKKQADKIKDKERAKEAKQARENIRAMIEGLDKQGDQTNDESTENANGVNTSKEKSLNHVDGANALTTNELGVTQIQSQSTTVATQTSEDEILSAINELLSKYKRLEDVVEDPKNGLSVQLAKTQGTVSQLYSDINGAVSGLKAQMAKVTKIAEGNSASIKQLSESQKQVVTLLEENKRLVHELKVMQGLIQKMSQQTNQNSTQITDITKRSMEQNLLLHGIDNSIEIEDQRRASPMFTFKERCIHSAIKFFKDIMNVDIEPADIWKAHRTGPKKEGKVRPMIVKLSYAAKDLIMDNISTLKDQSNSVTKQKYFISEQVPDGYAENKKSISSRLKKLREDNDKKAPGDRDSIQLISNTILVNNEIQEAEVTTPQLSQLFLDPLAQQEVDKVQAELVETEPTILRNSQFIGLAAKANSIAKVQRLYTAVIQRYPAVDHAIMAYALREQDQVKSGSCDDREFGAGSRLKKTIFETKSRDTVVFVLRKYGGVHLGFGRFAMIEQVAKAALDLLSQ